MKNHMSLISLVLFTIFLFGFGTLKTEAAEPEIIDSGICGRYYFDPSRVVTWELDDTGTLSFRGDWNISTYSKGNLPPWFAYWEQITNVVIEEGVLGIGDYAFYGCENIQSVSVPDSVKTIGESAFTGCSNLKSVYATDINTWCTIRFASEDANPLSTGALLYCGEQVVTEVTIEYSVSAYSFSGYTALKSVKFSEYAGTIGTGAFMNCTGLTSITLPQSIRQIHPKTFSGCTNLRNIDIPNSVNLIDDLAFYNCISLTEIVLPDVCELRGAFRGCTGLTNVIMPNGAAFISNGVFSDCTGLQSVTLPDSTTNIEGWAFNDCTGLESITIPKNVEYISENAFVNCSNLKIIEFLGIPKAIDTRAFSGCPVWHVLFPGSESDWNNIQFDDGYNILAYTTIHYNYTGGELIDPQTGRCSLCADVTCQHIWDNGKITQEPNCLRSGSVTYTCTVCKFTRNEYLEKKTEHTYSNDCATQCSVCGLTRPTDHHYTNEWHQSETHHWRECPLCKEKDPYSYGQHAPGEIKEDRVYCGCGYLISGPPLPTTAPTTEPTAPSSEPETAPSTEPRVPDVHDTESDNSVWWSVLGVFLLCGGIAGGVLWKKYF